MLIFEQEKPLKICQNCHRGDKGAEINWLKCERNHIKQRKKFRFVKCSRSSTENILLCEECNIYLTKEDGAKYKYMWPSFLYYFLTNHEVQQKYGAQKWRFIPETFRLWWNHIGNGPNSYFKDVTNEKREFDTLSKDKSLVKVAAVCNKYLMPNILCPWGCSEYMHRSGFISLDLVIQRYMPTINLQLISNVEKNGLLFSSRDDYIRKNDENDCILLNPLWKVTPKIENTKDLGPQVLTCGDHSGGTYKKYVHLPRNPMHHTLCSNYGDQLCQVVLKPRSIKPMKASSYSNSYQMHEQRGCFHGIDTCSLCSFGDFSNRDVILDENEFISISNRSDISSHLDTLEKNRVLSTGVSRTLKEHAKTFMTKEKINIERCLHGSTYVSMEDAADLQQRLNKTNLIEVILTNKKIQCKRNWVQHIIYSQKCSCIYGAQFSLSYPISRPDLNTSGIWGIGLMLTKVKQIWSLVERRQKKEWDWDGWFLTYFSRESYREELVITSRNSPYQTYKINSIQKFLTQLQKYNINYDSKYIIKDFFGKIKGMHVFEITELFDETIDIKKDLREIEVIIICSQASKSIIDDDQVEHDLEETIDKVFIEKYFYDCGFELRFIALLDQSSEGINNWNGIGYFRHGGIFTGWWSLEREKKLPIQIEDIPKSILIENLFSLVYVKQTSVNTGNIREKMMKHIGGQTHVLCAHHHIPLIVQSSTLNQKKTKCLSNLCDQPIYFGCPLSHCTSNLCLKCFHKYEVNILNYVRYEEKNAITTDDNTSEVTSVESICTTSSSSIQSKYEVENVKEIICNDESSIIENENCFDKYITHFDSYLDYDDLSKGSHCDIPTTDSGAIGFRVSNDNVGEIVDGHVLLNQCGSLLCRYDSHINSYRTQKHFLQRLASTVDNKCVPLLFPEAMMSPSIFWYLDEDNGSYPGALPSFFLASKVSLSGFASIKAHINIRLTNQFCSSSTNPNFVSFQFDILSNLLLNSIDSRLIIARGLTCEDGNVGIRVKSRKETSLHVTKKVLQVTHQMRSEEILQSKHLLQRHLPLLHNHLKLNNVKVTHVKEWNINNMYQHQMEKILRR